MAQAAPQRVTSSAAVPRRKWTLSASILPQPPSTCQCPISHLAHCRVRQLLQVLQGGNTAHLLCHLLPSGIHCCQQVGMQPASAALLDLPAATRTHADCMPEALWRCSVTGLRTSGKCTLRCCQHACMPQRHHCSHRQIPRLYVRTAEAASCGPFFSVACMLRDHYDHRVQATGQYMLNSVECSSRRNIC